MSQSVQKIRVPVHLTRVGAPPLAGLISLFPKAELHDGPETLLECLNASPKILPFEVTEEDVVLLITRDHIEWVQPDPTVEPRLVRPTPYTPTHEELVQVHMAGGKILEGIISMEMPNEFNRPSDYLNGADHFFPLRMQLGTRLLNKACVVAVRVRVARSVPRAA